MKRRRDKEAGSPAARQADPRTGRAGPAAGEDGSETWYVVEGIRGQQLLDQGRIGEATQVFEAILARQDEAPSYGRAVILGRLGRCCYRSGRHDLAASHVRGAIEVLGRLAPSDGVKSLRGTLRSELGDALRATGQYDDAKKAYEAALRIAEELKDLRGQGIDLGRLGALALEERNPGEAVARHEAARLLFQKVCDPALEAAACHQLARAFHKQRMPEEAERHYREAARINEERGDLAAAAQGWNELAALDREAGRPDAAEAWYRKALEVDRQTGNRRDLGRRLTDLADLLRSEIGRVVLARELAEEGLAVAQSLDPVSPGVWKNYGVLADIAESELLITGDEQRAALEMRARDFRNVERHGPLIVATLARLGSAPSVGKAVILWQLGRCFHLGRRSDLAVALVREAVGTAAAIAPGPDEDIRSFVGALHLDLGDMLHALGQDAEATEAHEAALAIAEALQDLRGQAAACDRLGRKFQRQRPRDETASFEVVLDDDLSTDYVFETDLLVDGPRERRVAAWRADSDPPADLSRPMLLPCSRTWMDEEGAVRFSLPLGEPIVERRAGCTVMRRLRREVAVSGEARVLWRMIARMDGTSTAGGILSTLTEGDRSCGARLLAALVATGVVDVSGRPVGRFLHSATKKGVLPAGGLEGDAVLRLATDGNYRSYPGAPQIGVSDMVPARLSALHSLTRSRRSRRDYGGPALERSDFDALLHTACGVTGAMTWAGRDVKLRAYPSSGALYAVEIYPIVFRVAGLDNAVYHYRAIDNVLDIVKPGIDPARVAGAALPVEREMVAGAAALICLAGSFPRHERKYGEGGYRMLVAEAGHISQNLVLAAIALGLSARPFGGVFDGLLNDDLGLDGVDEQFLLAVLVGHGAERGKE